MECDARLIRINICLPPARPTFLPSCIQMGPGHRQHLAFDVILSYNDIHLLWRGGWLIWMTMDTAIFVFDVFLNYNDIQLWRRLA